MEDQSLLNDDASLDGFWKWAYSDLRCNTIRPLIAEYLVGHALGCLDSAGRKEWAAWDLVYRGIRIEVKSAGYVQSWSQIKPSKISFDIKLSKNGWDAEANANIGPGRHAQVYVFCLHNQQDRDRAARFCPEDWLFYVVSTTHLESTLGDQKSLTLGRLKKLATPISLSELKPTVDKLNSSE
ncbi:MAG: hypothetical protein IT363_04560 [Methanoregulaceae archaeon]|nr:hypothetical protein [Methanoregulaceae archaeon]